MPTIDFAIFNELSMKSPARDATEAIRWLCALIDVMRRAHRVGFHRLRTRDDFRFSLLTASDRLIDLIMNLDHDRKGAILRILDSPYLHASQEDAFLNLRVLSVSGETCRDAEGLLCCHVADTLAISFPSEERWGVEAIELQVEQETSGETQFAKVRHAAAAEHVKRHAAWASRRTTPPSKLVPRADRPLPNTGISDQLVDDDWQRFFQTTSALSPAEKTARLREFAPDIAYVNGYDLCKQRSAANSKHAGAIRQVFVSAFTEPGREMYLSTDFETPVGAFEVCDASGRHLGEWLFSGRKNGGADLSGGHDILVNA